ncbi:hypothetical protein Gotur_014748 [Gossypium turneri]
MIVAGYAGFRQVDTPIEAEAIAVRNLAIFTAPASARPLVALKKDSSPKPRPEPSPKCSIVNGKRICV